MTGPEIAAIATALASVLVAVIALRRAPAETKKIEAEAEHEKSESNLDLAQISKVTGETWQSIVEQLRIEVKELRQRVQNAEERAILSDKHVLIYRSDVVRQGEEIVRIRGEYAEAIDRIKTMAGVIARLLAQLETLGVTPDVDPASIKDLAEIIQGSVA